MTSAPADLQRSNVLSIAVAGILRDLATQFEQSTGCRTAITYDRSGVVGARVLRGEIVDVVITTADHIDALADSDKIVPASAAVVAASRIGVAVRAGAGKPDISSAAALRQALLEARSVAYADPATGSPSGRHFVRVLDRLGIAACVAPKARVIGPSQGSVVIVCEAVASGQAELGIQQISEIIAVPDVELAGALPPELQKTTIFSAAVGSASRNAELARRFVAFITSNEALPVVRAKGMERPA